MADTQSLCAALCSAITSEPRAAVRPPSARARAFLSSPLASYTHTWPARSPHASAHPASALFGSCRGSHHVAMHAASASRGHAPTWRTSSWPAHVYTCTERSAQPSSTVWCAGSTTTDNGHERAVGAEMCDCLGSGSRDEASQKQTEPSRAAEK
eukprot:567122-Prymnesium_polylepis.1